MLRTWNQPSRNIFGFFLPFYIIRRRTEIFNSSIGTTSDKNIIYFNLRRRLSRIQAHIFQSFFLRFVLRSWHRLIYRNSHSRICSVSNHWLNISCIKGKFRIKNSTFISFQSFPISQFFFPFFPFWCELSSFYIIKSSFVWCNHSTSSSHFYAHIANRHSTFHRHIFENFTCIFTEITCSGVCSCFRNNVKNHIFWLNFWIEFSVNSNSH